MPPGVVTDVKTARDEFEAYQRDSADEPESHVQIVPLGKRMKSTGWRDAAGQLTAITHWIDGPEFGGCGGAEVQWGFAAVSDDGATVDRLLGGGSTRVVALLDLDGDGSPEVLPPPTKAGRTGPCSR